MKPTLPPAQMEVLALLVEGASTAQVAEKLHLSVHAVKCRIRTLQQLLGADTRTQAVAFAYQSGVLDVEPVDLPHLPAAGVPLKRLVEAREDRGFTQYVMAARLARSQAWVCQREAGTRPFTVADARRYARIVGVDLGEVTL